MSVSRELRTAARIGVPWSEWRAIGDEVWGESGWLFSTRDRKLAEHLVRLHNIAVPASNLLTRALAEVADLKRLLGVLVSEERAED